MDALGPHEYHSNYRLKLNWVNTQDSNSLYYSIEFIMGFACSDVFIPFSYLIYMFILPKIGQRKKNAS